MTSPTSSAARRRRHLFLALAGFLLVVGGVALVTISDDEEPTSEVERGGGLPAFVSDPERRALAPVFRRAAREQDVPVALLEALAWRESRWDASAVNPESGALGIGQLLPETAEFVATELLHEPDLNPTDARDNIRLTARYLRGLIERFDGDVSLGVAAYLQGSTSVADAGVSAQTATYVDQIMTLRRQFEAAARAGAASR